MNRLKFRREKTRERQTEKHGAHSFFAVSSPERFNRNVNFSTRCVILTPARGAPSPQTTACHGRPALAHHLKTKMLYSSVKPRLALPRSPRTVEP
jgi:hypothetical protein